MVSTTWDGTPWADVQFDHAAARDAVGALRQAAEQLKNTTEVRAAQARLAQRDWSGPTREEFDQRLAVGLGEAGALIDALLRAAGSIEAEIELAIEEQRRRVRERVAVSAGLSR